MKKLLLLSLLFTQPSFAEMMCDTEVSKYFAVYEINTYDCAPGYYLPANTDGCRVCDVFGKTCPGGTYAFNENESQGLIVGSYTCNNGYFLPANSDTCSVCPNGWTCSGGTYDFNPNEYQGAELNTITTNTMNNICADNFPIDLYAVYEPNTITINWNDGTNTSTSQCVFGTPCLYDKVERKFYYNAGTGQFIAGPVIGE